MEDLKVFTGNAHPALAQAVTEYLNIPLGNCEVFEFSNENIFIRILDNFRERDTFIIKPIFRGVLETMGNRVTIHPFDHAGNTGVCRIFLYLQVIVNKGS